MLTRCRAANRWGPAPDRLPDPAAPGRCEWDRVAPQPPTQVTASANRGTWSRRFPRISRGRLSRARCVWGVEVPGQRWSVWRALASVPGRFTQQRPFCGRCPLNGRAGTRCLGGRVGQIGIRFDASALTSRGAWVDRG